MNRRCKDGRTDVCKSCINKKRKESLKFKNNDNKKYYIYKFLNENNEVIYVGQTIDMNKRMYQHKTYNYKNYDLYNDVYKIRYAEVESDYHMNIYEIHYICKYNPKYNIQFKTNNKKLFNLPEVNWEQFVLKDYISIIEESYMMKTEGEIKDFIHSDWYKKSLKYYEKLRDTGDENLKYINYVNKYFNPNIFEDEYEYCFID